jgi:hypothetical protein
VATASAGTRRGFPFPQDSGTGASLAAGQPPGNLPLYSLAPGEALAQSGRAPERGWLQGAPWVGVPPAPGLVLVYVLG